MPNICRKIAHSCHLLFCIATDDQSCHPLGTPLAFNTEPYKNNRCATFLELQGIVEANLVESAARQNAGPAMASWSLWCAGGGHSFAPCHCDPTHGLLMCMK